MAATRQVRQVIALLVVVIGLGGSVWLLFVRGSGGVRFANSWNAVRLCTECGHKFAATVTIDSSLDAQACPKCGKTAAWEAKHCSKCNIDFVPKLVGNPPRPQNLPTCPQCGSDRYASSALWDGAGPPR